MSEKKSVCILELSHQESFDFFMKQESYCTTELPRYFNFTKLLKKLDMLSKNTDFNTGKMSEIENMNYTLLQNKDGNLSWRKTQILNPMAYIILLRIVTKEDAWKSIQDRFKEFENDKISCISLPVMSNSDEKDRAELIKNWWSDFEQQSIYLSLSYGYIYKTDIANCYDSIYTHSIAWALHGKEEAKKQCAHRDKKRELLGDKIDRYIRAMQYGQTNGIPQGSTLMDFIAEIVLGYVDCELYKEIEKEKSITDYKILRYRDDYRIFVNNPLDGERILKILSEKAFDVGMRFNASKTSFSKDIISSSIKDDKLSWITSHNFNADIQKHALIVRKHLINHPNSGHIIKELLKIYKRICGVKNIHHKPLTGIIVDIAYNNPSVVIPCIAILSCLLVHEEDYSEKIKILELIRNKFMTRHNNGYMVVWLQRLSLRFKREMDYEEPMCRMLFDNNVKLWDISWIGKTVLKNAFNENPIIDEDEIKNMKDTIAMKEFELFIYKNMKERS